MMEKMTWNSLADWQKSLIMCSLLLDYLEVESLHPSKRPDKFEGFASWLNTTRLSKGAQDA